MKVLVMNFSGNVGKTTVAANLLKPRLHAVLFSVESLNEDAGGEGVAAQRLRAKNFDALQQQLLAIDDAVVDVGASNVETFLEMMTRYDESHQDYDFVVVPTVKERKQINDTINTIEALLEIGVPKPKIKVLFNKVHPNDAVEDDFLPLFGYALELGLPVDPRACLHLNEVFELIKDLEVSLEEVINDPTDHKALLTAETTPEGKQQRIRRLAVKRLATSCARDMDSAFAALFPRH